MAKKPPPELDNSDFYYRWCLFVFEFIIEAERKSDLPEVFQMPEHSIEQKREILRKARERDRKRDWKYIYNDSVDSITNLGPGLQETLDSLLLKEFGFGVKDALGKRQNEIDRILKRDKILHADEYRILEERLNLIQSDPEHETETEAISKLLAKTSGPLPDE